MSNLTIQQIYEKLVDENLSTKELADNLQSTSYAMLRYELRKYCAENNLPIPRKKAGRKVSIKTFTLKS
jgi:hypothetical protein